MAYVTAEVCVLIGGLLLYLGTPHQKLLRSMPPKWPIRGAGLALFAAAIVIFAMDLSGSVSTFTAVVMAMAMWSLAPLLFALLQRRHISRK